MHIYSQRNNLYLSCQKMEETGWHNPTPFFFFFLPPAPIHRLTCSPRGRGGGLHRSYSMYIKNEQEIYNPGKNLVQSGSLLAIPLPSPTHKPPATSDIVRNHFCFLTFPTVLSFALDILFLCSTRENREGKFLLPPKSPAFRYHAPRQTQFQQQRYPLAGHAQHMLSQQRFK